MTDRILHNTPIKWQHRLILVKRGTTEESLYSRSSSKCVSMPSAPGTEQMSRAFRKVLHLFTKQQCPPSSFCLWHRRVSPSVNGRSSAFLLHPNPSGATHTNSACWFGRETWGDVGGMMVNTVSSYLDSPICDGTSPEPIQYKRTEKSK